MNNPLLPSAEEVSIWNQAMNLILLQREWADLSVSNSLMYRLKWKLIKAFSIFTGSIDLLNESKKWISRNADKFDHEFFLDALHSLTPEVSNDKYKVATKYNDDFELLEVKYYEYDPRHEEDDLEPVLASICPLIKSVALLPHSPKGAYKQQPEEGINKEEYEMRSSRLKPMDWKQLSGSDGVDEKYCSSDLCER
jgi:hypothetical protein